MPYDLASLQSGAGYGQMGQAPMNTFGPRGPQLGPQMGAQTGPQGPQGPQGGGLINGLQSPEGIPPNLAALLQAQMGGGAPQFGAAPGVNPFSGVGAGRPPVPMGGFSRPLGQPDQGQQQPWGRGGGQTVF